MAREADVDAAGIAVMTSCSAVSTLSSALVEASGIADPVRVSACLVPATRETATAATARSLLRCVGSPVTALRGGRLVKLRGFGESRPFEVGSLTRVGCLAESADAIHLPRTWPSLQTVDFWVDTNVPVLNRALRLAARMPGLPRLLSTAAAAGARLGRSVGSRAGGFGVEVEATDGRRVTLSLSAPAQSHLCGVMPAVLAVEHLATGPGPRGVVPNHRQVKGPELVTELERAGLLLVLGN